MTIYSCGKCHYVFTNEDGQRDCSFVSDMVGIKCCKDIPEYDKETGELLNPKKEDEY